MERLSHASQNPFSGTHFPLKSQKSPLFLPPPSGLRIVAIKLPKKRTVRRVPVEATIAPWKNDLALPIHNGEDWGRPLTVHDVLAWCVATPNHVPRILVHGQERGGFRFRHLEVPGTVASDAIHPIPNYERNGQRVHDIACVALEDPKFSNHVELPDDIGICSCRLRLVPVRTVVGPVSKPFQIDTNQLASIALVVCPRAVNRGF